MRIFIIFVAIIISTTPINAQSNYVISMQAHDKTLMKKLNLSEIVWDEYNEDGVFKGKSKSNGKWGMYQWGDMNKNPERLIANNYDSLGFFTGTFTLVKNNGQYGTLSGLWSGDELQGIQCKYEKLVNCENAYPAMVAVRSGEKWGYLHYETGDTLVPIEHHSFEALPTPSRDIYDHPMRKYPSSILAIIENPAAQIEIDLRDLDLAYIPKEIGKCSNAKKINLEGNQFSSLPAEFFNLHQLEKLYLGDNTSFRTFGKEFAQLKQLQTLIIGRKTSYGGYHITSSSFHFDPALAELKSLKFLVVNCMFDYDSLPNFIYSLPNLEYLEVVTPYLSEGNLQFDLNKMSCKETLTELSLGIIEDMAVLEPTLKQFKHIEELSLKTLITSASPKVIFSLPTLKDIYLIVFYKDEKDSYYGSTVLDYSTNDGPMSQEQKQEAMEKWKIFVNKHSTK